ncbi:MAG: glycosyl transferase family protein [bacterium]|nr:MAG: glycosyl transferase family protein [bacterium]
MSELYKNFSSLRNLLTNENWFRVAIAGIVIFSTCLRFWGLGRFDVLIFDEVHFANFAQDYLTNTHVFDAHPPLGKYFIAFGIWTLGFNPVGYRWVNALVGSFIPVLLIAIAYRLTGNKRYAFLAGLFASLDGLLLVEARHALLNTYLLFFGLLGHLFFLITLCKQGWRKWFFLTLTGICLGATIAVKWSGLSLIVAIYATWITIYLLKKVFSENLIFTKHYSEDTKFISPLEQIEQIKVYHLAIYLPLVIYFTYFLAWQPHLKQNPGTIGEIETQIYNFHKSYANRPEEHPYTSPWYTWPIMARPVSYFYETVKDSNELVPTGKKPVPLSETTLVYDIHAMGNPLLYLLALVSLLWIVFTLIEKFGLVAIDLIFQPDSNRKYLLAINFFVPLYLIISYSANLFSWAELVKNLAIIIVGVVFLGFLFFLPVYLGLPLSPRGFFLRMWSPSWI